MMDQRQFLSIQVVCLSFISQQLNKSYLFSDAMHQASTIKLKLCHMQMKPKHVRMQEQFTQFFIFSIGIRNIYQNP